MSFREFLSRLDEVGVYEPDTIPEVRDTHPRGALITAMLLASLSVIVACAFAYVWAVTR